MNGDVEVGGITLTSRNLKFCKPDENWWKMMKYSCIYCTYIKPSGVLFQTSIRFLHCKSTRTAAPTQVSPHPPHDQHPILGACHRHQLQSSMCSPNWNIGPWGSTWKLNINAWKIWKQVLDICVNSSILKLQIKTLRVYGGVSQISEMVVTPSWSCSCSCRDHYKFSESFFDANERSCCRIKMDKAYHSSRVVG